MKRTVLLLIAVATVAFVLVSTAPAFRRAEEAAAPTFVTTIPSGYRDWRLISVAHEEGNLNSLGAILGNDVAIKAYREGKLPFPDGTIIAALHYRHVPSEENNKVFGHAQSFVPGPPTNIQFMVKDSKKYAATGGWGFAHFTGRQTWRRGVHENLLPLPRTDQAERPCLHPLRTVKTVKTEGYKCSKNLVELVGLEPTTSSLRTRRSPRLSYSPTSLSGLVDFISDRCTQSSSSLFLSNMFDEPTRSPLWYNSATTQQISRGN